MAASFYVYEDISQYMLLYPGKQTVEAEIAVQSWHILPKKGVWVVVNLEHRLGHSTMEGSLKILLDGERGLKKHRTENLIDIDRTNIRFFYKDNVITFHSKEAVYEYRCDRYVGDPISKGKFKDFFIPSLEVSKYCFYDPGRNRINLILTDGSSEESQTSESSNSDPVSAA